MKAVRLEKFAPLNVDNVETAFVSRLEAETLQKESYEAGIRDGAAAANEAYSSETSRCLSQIHEAISDSQFEREKARRVALTALKPLVQTIAITLAPALSEATLFAEIANIANKAARDAPEEKLIITVQSGLEGEISSQMISSVPEVTVLGDRSLSESQARVSWGGGFDEIDISAVSTAVSSLIDEFFTDLNHPNNSEVIHAS